MPRRFNYNKEEVSWRDEILFGAPVNWEEDGAGGIEHFQNATYEQIEQLVADNFADINEKQNDSPSIGTFLDFMHDFPGLTAHGYVVSPYRDDYRVTVEGLEFKGKITPEMRKVFSQFKKRGPDWNSADEFELKPNYFRCWWD